MGQNTIKTSSRFFRLFLIVLYSWFENLPPKNKIRGRVLPQTINRHPFKGGVVHPSTVIRGGAPNTNYGGGGHPMPLLVLGDPTQVLKHNSYLSYLVRQGHDER